jgi:hypothetical protein
MRQPDVTAAAKALLAKKTRAWSNPAKKLSHLGKRAKRTW